MFPTFDIPPQHSETVGARKARRAKEDETARRSSTATSQSSSSGRSVRGNGQRLNTANPDQKEKSGFGWFGKKKGIQEIAPLPSTTKKNELVTETEIPPPTPAPRTSPLPPPEIEPLRRQPSYQSDRERDSLAFQQPSYPPPMRSLPSVPPSNVSFPQPPSPGHLSTFTTERKSLYSTTSTDRTTFSNRSIFSTASYNDDAISEESFAPSRYPASNMQFEAVERGSRTGSRQGDHAAKTAQGPFARALAKMEGAGSRIISARLSEEWEGLDDDESYREVIFDKRLWALTAYQRLTQNKHLQSPAHELLSVSRPADQRRILHLHGSLADGWMLATRYPAATVYTLSSVKSSTSPTTYPAPLNHHSLYVPSISSATPFPDGYFDAIISRSVSTVLRNDEWARTFFDCMRTLKPGGQMEVLSIDAHMSCEGPKLSSWVDEHLSCRLEAHSLSKQASDTVLDTMEIVGLENIRRARVALPAHAPKTPPRVAPPPSHTYGSAMPTPTPQDSLDASKMMTFLGRHFYQDLYGSFMHTSQGEEWFWARKDIREECERFKTKMILTISCAQKPSTTPISESYLDI